MMESLPILCCFCAFTWCALAVFDGFICTASGPLKPECKKLSNLGFPMASLSLVAAVAVMVLSTTGGTVIRR